MLPCSSCCVMRRATPGWCCDEKPWLPLPPGRGHGHVPGGEAAPEALERPSGTRAPWRAGARAQARVTRQPHTEHRCGLRHRPEPAPYHLPDVHEHALAPAGRRLPAGSARMRAPVGARARGHGPAPHTQVYAIGATPVSRRGRKALEGPESAREGPPWSTFPEPAAIVLLHLQHRERGYKHVPMADAAYERISRKGPVWDGKHVGTRAIERWRESKAVSAPGVELEPTESTRTETAAGSVVRAPERAQPDTRARHARAPSTAESPGVTAAGSESAETTRPDTEQVSEKEPSPFVQRWRARFKRLHSSHG